MENEGQKIEKKERKFSGLLKKKSPADSVTEKDLKRMGRRELVEILYEMKLREEELLEELDQADKRLKDCEAAHKEALVLAEQKRQDQEIAFKEELDAAEKKLENKEIQISQSGSIAEAAMNLNGIFEAAQKTADHYLISIRKTEREKEKIIEQAHIEAQRIIAVAEQEADKVREDTKLECTKKVLETERTIELNWIEFKNNVEKTLRAHEELTEVLKMTNVIS